MPNHQKHRGQHPSDKEYFNEKWINILRLGVQDLNYLFERDYPDTASVKLVGDKYRLNERQRKALFRASTPPTQNALRQQKQITTDQLKGQNVAIDGYNQLIITESMLSGGLIFRGTDHILRDLASLHGSYRKVEETLPAFYLLGEALVGLEVQKIHWFLDSPISNSGRLKVLMAEIAQEKGWDWDIQLVHSPDKALAEIDMPVITSDAWILDQAKAWFNLPQHLIDKHMDKHNVEVQLVDLGA